MLLLVPIVVYRLPSSRGELAKVLVEITIEHAIEDAIPGVGFVFRRGARCALPHWAGDHTNQRTRATRMRFCTSTIPIPGRDDGAYVASGQTDEGWLTRALSRL